MLDLSCCRNRWQCPVICAEEKCHYFWYLFPEWKRERCVKEVGTLIAACKTTHYFRDSCFRPHCRGFQDFLASVFYHLLFVFMFVEVTKISFLKHFQDVYIVSIETQLIHALESCLPVIVLFFLSQ